MSEMFAFEREPEKTRLETSIVSSGEEDGRPFVVLEDTILYPEGGGQPADRGTIDGIAVVHTGMTVLPAWLTLATG